MIQILFIEYFKYKNMAQQTSLAQLNDFSEADFVAALADIFEHSAWIPQRVCEFRPFSSLKELHLEMADVVNNATEEKKIELLNAHPELAGKEAKSGQLPDASTSEQANVGMNALNMDEMLEVAELNRQYRDKFGFPFIIAVRDNTKSDIFRKWRDRLSNSRDIEIQTCLEQVYLIAKIRLTDLAGDELN